MKSIIKYIMAGVFAVVFSAPVFAKDYEHTIDYLMFQGYEHYGISATVETNTDTVVGMTLYVAIYNTDGRLLEVSTLPLDQNKFGERKVYRLKVTTVLDENMTVKAMIMKDLKPYAEAISVKYDKKYNSGSSVIISGNTSEDDSAIKIDKEDTDINLEDLVNDDVIPFMPNGLEIPTVPSLEYDDILTDDYKVVKPEDVDVIPGYALDPFGSTDKYEYSIDISDIINKK